MRQGATRQEVGGHDLGIGPLLIATLGAPVAWALHRAVCYFLVALACTTSWRGTGVTVAILAVTAVLGAFSAWCGRFSYRRWRALGGEGGWDRALDRPGGRGGFYWILGVLLSGLFTLVIVLEGLPPLFVPTCAPLP